MGGPVRTVVVLALFGSIAVACTGDGAGQAGGDPTPEATVATGSPATTRAPVTSATAPEPGRSTPGPTVAVSATTTPMPDMAQTPPHRPPELQCVQGLRQAGSPPLYAPAPDIDPGPPTVARVEQMAERFSPMTPEGEPPVVLTVDYAGGDRATAEGRSGDRLVFWMLLRAHGGEWVSDGHEACYEGAVNWQLPPPIPARTPLRVEGSWAFGPPAEPVPQLDVVAIAEVARPSIARITPIQALNYGAFSWLDADGRPGPSIAAVDVAANESDCGAEAAAAPEGAPPSAVSCMRHVLVDPATLTVLAEVTTPMI